MTFREKVAACLDTPMVRYGIIAVIIFNAVILGLETSDTVMNVAGPLIHTLDRLCLAVPASSEPKWLGDIGCLDVDFPPPCSLFIQQLPKAAWHCLEGRPVAGVLHGSFEAPVCVVAISSEDQSARWRRERFERLGQGHEIGTEPLL